MTAKSKNPNVYFRKGSYRWKEPACYSARNLFKRKQKPDKAVTNCYKIVSIYSMDNGTTGKLGILSQTVEFTFSEAVQYPISEDKNGSVYFVILLNL